MTRTLLIFCEAQTFVYSTILRDTFRWRKARAGVTADPSSRSYVGQPMVSPTRIVSKIGLFKSMTPRSLRINFKEYIL